MITASQRRSNNDSSMKARRASELAPLEDEAATALIDCEQARRTFQQAEQRHRTSDANLNRVRSSYAAQVRSLEKQIASTAPPEIDVFISELQTEIERMQKSGASTTVDRKQSNRLSFEARMAALRRTIDDAGKLKTKAIDGLPARLERMRSAIPELEMVSGQCL